MGFGLLGGGLENLPAIINVFDSSIILSCLNR